MLACWLATAVDRSTVDDCVAVIEQSRCFGAIDCNATRRVRARCAASPLTNDAHNKISYTIYGVHNATKKFTFGRTARTSCLVCVPSCAGLRLVSAIEVCIETLSVIFRLSCALSRARRCVRIMPECTQERCNHNVALCLLTVERRDVLG